MAKLAANFKMTKEPLNPPAAATTKRGWQRPQLLTQAPHGVAQEAWPHLQFVPPRFDGEKVVEWIHNIQIYYNHSYTPLSDRLYLTKYLLDHPASDWMTDWTDNNAGKGWDDFLFAVKQRFDPEPYADYAETVRKPHNSSSDLLAWSDAPSPAVSSTANAVRANQPVDGVYKVLLDGKITEENAGQITEATAGILNKRKPCSAYKPKAMNDCGDGSTGSGAYDDIVKCRTSVCIVQRAPLTAGDSSNPRLLEKEKFACFDDTSDAGPKPLFSDGRKSCLEPNTLLGVGNQDVFRQEQILASDARSIPPREDVTRSGGSLSSSLRQSDPSTMLEVEKGMLDIEELGVRIVTSSIRPSLHLNLEVGNSLLDMMNSMTMKMNHCEDVKWRSTDLQWDSIFLARLPFCIGEHFPLVDVKTFLEPLRSLAQIQNAGIGKSVGNVNQDHDFNPGGSFVAKFVDRNFTVGECGLDYDRLLFYPAEDQRWYFKKAYAMKLPMLLHARASAEDLCNILERNKRRFFYKIRIFDSGIFESGDIDVVLNPRRLHHDNILFSFSAEADWSLWRLRQRLSDFGGRTKAIRISHFEDKVDFNRGRVDRALEYPNHAQDRVQISLNLQRIF